MNCLVAGGAGFIGSHLCDRLLAAGHQVLCVDSLITGSPRNVAHLASTPGFELLHHDVTHPLEADTDAIFHLASPASPVAYQAHPEETALANALGSYHLLALARRKAARYLFASTSEVYGDPLEHPQRDSYWGNVNPIGPRACYDESKRFGEALTTVYEQHYAVDARIVRIFNTYGPRSDPQDGRLVPNFITQALRGEALTVYGDGTQTRSLCYVDDLVAGIEAAMFRDATRGSVFNLGNPEEHTVLEYAELIREMVNPAVPVDFRPLPADDPTRRRPDITRAQAVLGWSPRVALRDGIARTIAWFRPNLAAPSRREPG
jgi:nucleoside-diphosphate-sugar epimerase